MTSRKLEAAEFAAMGYVLVDALLVAPKCRSIEKPFTWCEGKKSLLGRNKLTVGQHVSGFFNSLHLITLVGRSKGRPVEQFTYAFNERGYNEISEFLNIHFFKAYLFLTKILLWRRTEFFSLVPWISLNRKSIVCSYHCPCLSARNYFCRVYDLVFISVSYHSRCKGICGSRGWIWCGYQGTTWSPEPWSRCHTWIQVSMTVRCKWQKFLIRIPADKNLSETIERWINLSSYLGVRSGCGSWSSGAASLPLFVNIETTPSELDMVFGNGGSEAASVERHIGAKQAGAKTSVIIR